MVPMMPGPLRQSLSFGLVCALLALLPVGVLLLGSPGGDWLFVLGGSPVAAFAAGAVSWRVVAGRTRGTSLGFGLLAGMLAGLGAHPLAWTLALPWLGDMRGAGKALQGVLLMSAVSALTLGWVTALLGGLGGLVMAWRLRHAAQPNPTPQT